MKMPRISVRSRLAAAAAAVTLAGGGVALGTASPALAYGNGSVYQVELSANISGPAGGGVWLWIGLDNDGTGDYHGADCGHKNGPATSDGGNVTWTTDGTTVTIKGVVLNGLGGFPATVTVPAAFGHYTGTIGSFITLPSFIPPTIGSSQLQVAP
jgi:hypothetical protein